MLSQNVVDHVCHHARCIYSFVIHPGLSSCSFVPMFVRVTLLTTQSPTGCLHPSGKSLIRPICEWGVGVVETLNRLVCTYVVCVRKLTDEVTFVVCICKPYAVIVLLTWVWWARKKRRFLVNTCVLFQEEAIKSHHHLQSSVTGRSHRSKFG